MVVPVNKELTVISSLSLQGNCACISHFPRNPDFWENLLQGWNARPSFIFLFILHNLTQVSCFLGRLPDLPVEYIIPSPVLTYFKWVHSLPCVRMCFYARRSYETELLCSAVSLHTWLLNSWRNTSPRGRSSEVLDGLCCTESNVAMQEWLHGYVHFHDTLAEENSAW